jgi:hypothetical protein
MRWLLEASTDNPLAPLTANFQFGGVDYPRAKAFRAGGSPYAGVHSSGSNDRSPCLAHDKKEANLEATVNFVLPETGAYD